MILFKKKKPSLDEMKREIIQLIDESREAVYKIAFYAKPEVQSILDEVFKRWEKAGYVGRPIDYATREELEILYKIAKKISAMSPGELWGIYGRELPPGSS